MFESIIKWIDYDFDERIEQLPLLMCECVRFALLSPIEHKNISQHRYYLSVCTLNLRQLNSSCPCFTGSVVVAGKAPTSNVYHFPINYYTKKVFLKMGKP